MIESMKQVGALDCVFGYDYKNKLSFSFSLPLTWENVKGGTT